MKKFCALFACAFFIIAQTITYIPVKAVGTTVDFGEMLNEYLNVAEMGLALSQGATIDWSELEIPEELETDQEKAKYIVNYLGALRHTGIQAIYDWMFNGENDNPYLQNTAAIGLSTTSGIGAEGTQDIRSQLANIIATNSSEHVFQKYSDAVIARWNNYNTNYINDYLTSVNYRDNANPLPISLQPYESYIAIGNGWNYFVSPQTGGTGNKYGSKFIQNMYLHPNVSIVYVPGTSYYYQSNNLNINEYINSSGAETGILYAYDLNNVDFYCFINSETHRITFPDVDLMIWVHDEYGSRTSAGCYRNINNIYPIVAQYGGGISKPNTFNFNSNEAAFLWYSQYCVNCPLLFGTSVENAIRVEASGYNISGGFTVTIPDAVIDSGTDDGKIVAHPIYYPDTVKNGGTISIDLDTLNDIIAQKIAAGATSISMDDVIDAGAVIDADGTTILTDTDTKVTDVSVPIAKAGSIDTTITPTFPNLNIIPPLPILPDINTGDANSGFQGMSVLARIINVTVQSCPEPLIMTFFGVIFGVVILGIIMILHH